MNYYLSADQIKKLIDDTNIKVVSFDIFDTLLVRPCYRPTDIFYLLDYMKTRFRGKRFSEIRVNAERDLKLSNPTLKEIWHGISIKEHLSEIETDCFMNAELMLEKDMLLPRQDVKEIYEYALEKGKKVIAISDMYLSQEFLAGTLTEKGYTHISKAYVSCEYGARKDSGELFDLVLDGEDIAPNQILHIGDNYHSDFQVPLKKGIEAVYYPSVWDIVFQKGNAWDRLFSTREVSDDPTTRLLFSALLLQQYNAGRFMGVNTGRFFSNMSDIGRMLVSPVAFLAALDMAKNNEIQKTYTKICFAARDGFFPQKVYDLVAPLTKGVPSKYLYISRHAVNSVIYPDFLTYVAKEDFHGYSYSLGQFLACNILDEKLRTYLLCCLSEDEKNIDLSSNRESGVAKLEKHREVLDEYFDKQRSATKEYYQRHFLSGQNRELVFDCGYSGSVSRGLLKAYGGDKKFDKYYLWQTDKNREQDEKEKTKTFCPFGTYLPIAAQLLYEELFSPQEGTCMGFVHRDGEIKPCFENVDFNAAMVLDLNEVQDASLRSCEQLVELFKRYIPKENFIIRDPQLFIRIADAAFCRSLYREIELLENIRFPDTSCNSENYTLSYKMQKAYYGQEAYTNVLAGTGLADPSVLVEVPSHIAVGGHKIGIHVHLYNLHLYEELLSYLAEFPFGFDLYVTVTNGNVVQMVEQLFTKNVIPNVEKCQVILSENRGRDVAPWLIGTKDVQSGYDYFCHIHSKESTQYKTGTGECWRRYLYDNLLEKQAVIDTVKIFDDNENIGCVFPAPFSEIRDMLLYNSISVQGKEGEESIVNALLSKMCFDSIAIPGDLLFSVGTMFWYRPEAIKPLFDLGLHYEDFPPEPVGTGGTIAHAIERMPPVVAKRCGYESRIFTKYPEKTIAQVEKYSMTRSVLPEGYDKLGIKNGMKILWANIMIFVRKHIERKG